MADFSFFGVLLRIRMKLLRSAVALRFVLSVEPGSPAPYQTAEGTLVCCPALGAVRSPAARSIDKLISIIAQKWQRLNLRKRTERAKRIFRSASGSPFSVRDEARSAVWAAFAGTGAWPSFCHIFKAQEPLRNRRMAGPEAGGRRCTEGPPPSAQQKAQPSAERGQKRPPDIMPDSARAYFCRFGCALGHRCISKSYGRPCARGGLAEGGSADIAGFKRHPFRPLRGGALCPARPYADSNCARYSSA